MILMGNCCQGPFALLLELPLCSVLCGGNVTEGYSLSVLLLSVERQVDKKKSFLYLELAPLVRTATFPDTEPLCTICSPTFQHFTTYFNGLLCYSLNFCNIYMYLLSRLSLCYEFYFVFKKLNCSLNVVKNGGKCIY